MGSVHLEPGRVKFCTGKAIFGHGKGVVGHKRRPSGALKGHMGHCGQGFGCYGQAKIENCWFFIGFKGIFERPKNHRFGIMDHPIWKMLIFHWF